METSLSAAAGVHQSFAGVGDVCRANNTLFLADTVCSLGGVPFFADEWKVDAMYSGSQKCLSAPPGGCAPHTLSAACPGACVAGASLGSVVQHSAQDVYFADLLAV